MRSDILEVIQYIGELLQEKLDTDKNTLLKKFSGKIFFELNCHDSGITNASGNIKQDFIFKKKNKPR